MIWSNFSVRIAITSGARQAAKWPPPLWFSVALSVWSQHAAPALPASPRQHRVRHACTLSVPPHAQGLQPWAASTAACLIHPPALRSGQTAVAGLLGRAARPGLDAGARRQYIPHAYKQGGQAAEDP